jgi:hypothetical protein
MKLKRKYLKNEEMLTIDLKNTEMKVKDSLASEERIKIQLLKANIALIEAEIYKKQQAISKIMEEKEKIRVSLTNYTNDIKKQCGVKADKWGFNPITGEIEI